MALREQQGLMLPEPELNQTQVKCRVAKNTNTLINKNILSIGF